MNETYVNYEIAKLLKELGFDWGCYEAFNANTRKKHSFDACHFNTEKEYFSAPTHAVARKWLRDVKGVDVEVYIRRCYHNGEEVKSKNYNYEWCVIEEGTIVRNDFMPNHISYKEKNTYEEAESEGIEQALDYLKNNKL